MAFLLQVRGKYDAIESMLYKETGQYSKQIGNMIHSWYTHDTSSIANRSVTWLKYSMHFSSGALEAVLERQKGELANVEAEHKEAATFRWYIDTSIMIHPWYIQNTFLIHCGILVKSILCRGMNWETWCGGWRRSWKKKTRWGRGRFYKTTNIFHSSGRFWSFFLQNQKFFLHNLPAKFRSFSHKIWSYFL